VHSEKPICPPSATHGAVAAIGFAAFLLSLTLVKAYRPFGGNLVHSVLFIIGITAISISLVDTFQQKVYLRSSTGLRFEQGSPSWSRTLYKFGGLLASMGFIGLLYWVFPEYHSAFYDNYYQMLKIVIPVWILLALPYFYLFDRYMQQPHDGFWYIGKLMTMQTEEMDSKIISQHALGWLVKGFFLPLMFSYTCGDLGAFLTYDITRLINFQSWYNFLYDSLYFIDVTFATMGYLISLRITDTHLRSVEPTMLGWWAALICYSPFWPLASERYFAYNNGYEWGTWLSKNPVLYDLWGIGILTLAAIYAWATISFGVRFSNLTNRGIITNGPYRWTKHPAYVAKNLSWWMLYIPFIAQGRPDEAIRHCLQLLALNGIYMLRAKTEERHLSNDPEYVAYAAWMREHSIVRFIRRLP
jgi:protein-S-isoprenylcysteine O-methyltransferase Ste14